MAGLGSRHDNEKNSYKLVDDGGTDQVAQRVSVVTSPGSPLSSIVWDALDVQQTSSTVETYVFKTGGISGTIVATCVVTYTDATKKDLNTVVWS